MGVRGVHAELAQIEPRTAPLEPLAHLRREIYPREIAGDQNRLLALSLFVAHFQGQGRSEQR